MHRTTVLIFVVKWMKHNRRLDGFPIVTLGFNAEFKGLVNIAVITVEMDQDSVNQQIKSFSNLDP